MGKKIIDYDKVYQFIVDNQPNCSYTKLATFIQTEFGITWRQNISKIITSYFKSGLCYKIGEWIFLNKGDKNVK